LEHQDTSDNDNDDDVAIPRGKSIAHHYMSSKMVYVSFDMETGGEKCGIIQMSANVCRKNELMSALWAKLGKYRFMYIGKFNSYFITC